MVPFLDAGADARAARAARCSYDDFVVAGSRADPVRAAAVRPPDLHPVLVGHDRRAQGDRARRRRHAAPAPEGAAAAHRPQAGGSDLLLHHLRLDDVELAGRARSRPARPWWCTTARRSIPTATACSTWRKRKGSPSSAPAPSTSTPSRRPALEPARTHDLERAARDPLDRLAAGARELRLRLPQHQDGPAPRLDLRRHRHRVVLRARQSDRAGVARRAADPRPRHGGRGVERARASRWSASPASWSASSRSRRCRSASGTIPTAAATARPISSASPASGRTATTSS